MSTEIKVPALGESIVEATVGKWLKREGEPVAAGEALVELETDKVSIEVTAAQAGVLERILRAEGQNVTIGEVLGTVGEAGAPAAQNGAPAAAAPAEPASAEPAPAVVSPEQRVVATPVAQRVAEHAGVDVKSV